MSIKSKAQLKGYFETGDVPTQSNFSDLVDSSVRTLDTISDLRSIDSSGYPDNSQIDVSGYYSNNDGGGGVFYLDTSDSSSLDNGGIIIVDSSGGRWFRDVEDNETNLLEWGGKNDRTYDNTSIVQDMIDYVYGKSITINIPQDCKWGYDDINNAYSGTAKSGTTNTSVTDTSQSWGQDELVGCFVWNTTDKSYGTITSNTSNTFTAQLYIGDTNNWDVGDAYTISKHRVDVTIVDKSNWDFFRDSWTGQYKVIVNSNLPHQDSANEFWFQGPYHPSFIAVNTGVGGMEARASFISRWYNGNTLEKTYQHSFQQDTGNFNGSNIRYELVGANDAFSSSIIMSYYNPSDEVRNIGVGARARDDHNYYQRNSEAGTDNVIGYYTPNSTNHDIKYYVNNDNSEVLRCIIRPSGDLEYYNSSGGLIGRIRSSGSLVSFKRQTTSYSTSASLSSNQSMSVLTNASASGNITITLPQAEIGMEFTFIVKSSNAFNISPFSGDQIQGTLAVDSAISSSTVGDSITLICASSGVWDVSSEYGNWSF